MIRFDEVGVCKPWMIQIMAYTRDNHCQFIEHSEWFVKHRVFIITRLKDPVANMSDIERVSHVVEWHQKVFIRNLAQETDKLYVVNTKCFN